MESYYLSDNTIRFEIRNCHQPKNLHKNTSKNLRLDLQIWKTRNFSTPGEFHHDLLSNAGHLTPGM